MVTKVSEVKKVAATASVEIIKECVGAGKA